MSNHKTFNWYFIGAGTLAKAVAEKIRQGLVQSPLVPPARRWK